MRSGSDLSALRLHASARESDDITPERTPALAPSLGGKCAEIPQMLSGQTLFTYPPAA